MKVLEEAIPRRAGANPLTEGTEKKGGANTRPATEKPPIRPAAQNPGRGKVHD